LRNFREDAEIFTENLPSSDYTSYTQNKGEKVSFCMRQKDGSDELVDINTLMFVALHEMGHIMSVSVGHE